MIARLENISCMGTDYHDIPDWLVDESREHMSGRGCFITVEGVEGAGKSSCLGFICDRLKAEGLSVVQTREPGGTPLAESLRGVLLDDWEEGMPGMTELLIVFAARAAHLRNRIWPQLEAGSWVVSDRFTDATYAYQGAGRGLSAQPVATLEALVQGPFRPHQVLLFDLPVEEGLARTRKRHDGDNNRFDREALVFMERVRQSYLRRAEEDPERYTIIDAADTPQGVRAQVDAALRQILGRYRV